MNKETFKLRMSVAVLTAVGAFGLVSALAQPAPPAAYLDPTQARQMIQEIMQSPQSRGPEADFYTDGISFIDDFIPFMPFMKTTYNPGKGYWKFTYLDGRFSKGENHNVQGTILESYQMWNNSTGAPILGYYHDSGDKTVRYVYMDYNADGKPAMWYQFSSDFVLGTYRVYTYEGERTSWMEYTTSGFHRGGVIYDSNGDLYSILNGRTNLVNYLTRKDEVCKPTKFGLKPIYPGY